MAVQQSTTAVSGAVEGERGARATRGAQQATWLGVLALLGVLSLGRLLVAAFGYGIPAWFDEELNPLIALISRGQPITQIDARQYGAVVFLVFDPALRVLMPTQGLNLSALATYATWVALCATVVAFAFTARRYAADATSGSRARLLVLLVAWSSAVPLLYVIAQHMVDAWQLAFLSVSLFLFTGSGRQRRFAGLPLAAATLTKILPGLLLVYLCLRSWRAGLIGVAGVGLLLAVGQLLYGSLMGFGYPLAMLAGGGDTIARWSTHFENNSIRGLLFKLGAGFRLRGDTEQYILDPRLVPFLNVLAYALAAALVGYLFLVAWRGRGRDSIARRSIEFSLAIFTMLLVSPHTAQDYLVTTLPVLAVWLYLWSQRLPRPWSIRQTALGALAALLIGVFVPMNLFARILPLGWLVNVTDNAHNILFVDQIGSAIGAYEFFGFPGIGLLLGWLLLVRLERQTDA
ncbi:MAG TPA: glycosyltransferase family 87 protein [Chloroflexota bacterium]|nr:glycosyltransferase family 87 protein [Chloroflexota bacterium]